MSRKILANRKTLRMDTAGISVLLAKSRMTPSSETTTMKKSKRYHSLVKYAVTPIPVILMAASKVKSAVKKILA